MPPSQPFQGTTERFQTAATEPPFRKPAGLSALLARWSLDPRVRQNLQLDEWLPGRAASSVPLPPSFDGIAPALRGGAMSMPRALASALAARGIDTLYSHQREAYEAAVAGRDLVIATPTASGKSLCYNLPVLSAFAADRSARALYLFPTKALARDQEAALRSLMSDAGLSSGAITYDGDTPADARRAARQHAGVLLTNPDMLHAGILPHHTSWARFFADLRYVVIDELHVYRGVFGSHLANVLRRLARIAQFHGSQPVFLLASATIGNPHEHACRVTGRDVQLIDESGAPNGPRRLLVYNPPVVNAELGIRESYLKAAVRLTSELVSAGVSTLLFGQSRNNVEVMLKYLRERLARENIPPERVAAYRGGYLPELRRGIEQSLRDGDLACVVATSALELGIDIGALDAVVCAGYPGTLAGLYQRFGRSGRRGGESLALLVASSAPLDQYVARQHAYLLGAPIEQARIDPDNAEILVQHVKCAAFELPFASGEGFGDVDAEVAQDALEFLSGHGLLHPVQNGESTVFHWASDAYPANHVSLRSVGWDNFVIIDVERDKTIAEMDFRATHTMLHEQAIYQQEGEQYQVERLDFDNHKAFVRKVSSDYFTDAMTHVRVSVLEVSQHGSLRAEHGVGTNDRGEHGEHGTYGRGDVSVVEKVVGFKKIRYHTHENVGYGEVNLPEMQMHTSAFWLTIPEPIVKRQPVLRAQVIDALRGIAHALHTVASVGLMTDPGDLGTTIHDARSAGSSTARSARPAAREAGEPADPAATAIGGIAPALRGGATAISGIAPALRGGATAASFDPTLFLYDRVPGGVGLAPRIYQAREELLRRARALIEGCRCEQGCPACVGPRLPMDVALAATHKQIALAVLADLGVAGTH